MYVEKKKKKRRKEKKRALGTGNEFGLLSK